VHRHREVGVAARTVRPGGHRTGHVGAPHLRADGDHRLDEGGIDEQHDHGVPASVRLA
jgi:hypothetical protein